MSGPSDAGMQRPRNALRGYLAEAIKQRSANPADDLISALVTARDESDALSEDELLAFVVLLLLAGNETTTISSATVCSRYAVIPISKIDSAEIAI